MTFVRRSRFRESLLLAGAVLTAGCGTPAAAPVSQDASALEAQGEPQRLEGPTASAAPLQPVGFRCSLADAPFPPAHADSATDEPADDGPAAAAKARAFDWGTLDSDAPLDVTGANAGSAPPLAGPAELEPYLPPPLVADANLSEPIPLPPVEWDMGTAANPSAGAGEMRGPDIGERLPGVVRTRSAEMDAVARRADALVRRGFRLAERGAVYSARANFFEALGLIARSLDIERGTQEYSRALAAGSTALAEGAQFAEHGSAVPLNLARIVAVHRTPVIKTEPLDALSPVIAQRRYYTFAQEQLALAAAGERASSLALYGLAKTAAQIESSAAAVSLATLGQQVTCYQASLIADPNNFRAANELGVILAESGRVETARQLFQRSLAISEQAATWHNLAVVEVRLGNADAAARAERRAEQLRSTRLGAITGDNLRWVDAKTFAATTSPTDGLLPPAAVPGPTAATPAAPAATKKRTALGFPWSRDVRR